MQDADDALPDAGTLFDNAACGLLLTGPDGTIRRVNDTFCRWVGYSREELLGQRRLQDLLTMGGRIFQQTHLAPLMQIQGSVAEVKLDIVHRQGHTVPMMLNAVIQQHAGTAFRALAMFVAEDRHKYERELLLARRKAETLLLQQREIEEALTRSQAELDRQRGQAEDRALFAEQMVGIVSHDLRNPLSAIQMSAYLLGRGELTTHQQRALARIAISTNRAQRLIADLLDFTLARVGTGLAVVRQAIDLHGLVSECVEELALSFPGRELVHRRIGEGGCTGDADRLTQVVGNLVANAISYGAVDRPVIVTSRIDADDFLLQVHNEGSPIAPDAVSGLFEPMTRSHTAANPARSVGLGLFIVREIAHAHGGKATVASTRDTGTTFTVACPR
jgi:sigma-B regulation protein RsbU (phosphoserine phosphatase)